MVLESSRNYEMSPTTGIHQHEKNKRKLTVEDDFFSLSTQASKKKSRKRTKDREKPKVNSEQDSIILQENIHHDSVNPKTTNIIDYSIDTSEKEALEIDLSGHRRTNRSDHHEDEPKSSSLLSDELKEFISNIDDSDDDFELDDQSMTRSKRSSDYDFDYQSEQERRYIIRVVSKIPRPPQIKEEIIVDFGTKGTKSFSKINDAIVNHFRTIYDRFPDFKDIVSPNELSLVWLEGRLEIKPFFKPSTLRIPPKGDIFTQRMNNMPPTSLTCLLIPKENVDYFTEIYEEFQDKKNEKQESLHSSDDDSLIELENVNEDYSSPGSKDVLLKNDDSSDAQYFVIGLKGKDNKRHEVQVTKNTVISKLLDFYIKIKRLDNSQISAAKLVFDDEELDLDSTIGETEIEEDFEVQVFL